MDKPSSLPLILIGLALAAITTACGSAAATATVPATARAAAPAAAATSPVGTATAAAKPAGDAAATRPAAAATGAVAATANPGSAATANPASAPTTAPAKPPTSVDGRAPVAGAATSAAKPPTSADGRAPVAGATSSVAAPAAGATAATAAGTPISAGAPAAGAAAGGQRRLVPTTVSVPSTLRTGALGQERQLEIREGFTIEVVARVAGARSMEMAPWGELLVTQPSQGRIVAVRADADAGAPAAQRTLVEGLQCPYGMAFRDNHLYVSQSTKVERFTHDARGGLGPAEVVVQGLPQSGCSAHHFRPLAIDAGGNLYVAFGSSCNVCVESDPRRGTVWRYGPDGAGREYARGLRNVVDLELHPQTGQLWGVTNERDQLGDDVPPDPVGPIQEGADYGWPYCYWTGSAWTADTRVPARAGGCAGLANHFGVQAHSAPLGMAFAGGGRLPADYAGSALVALHGSWNRSQGTGFKVVRVSIVDGQPRAAEDLVTGWLTGPRGPSDAWGRPVDVQAGPDGSFFVSDDVAGAVYRVRFAGAA
jgi:glucose/arabinose dehydrogenase